MIQLKDVDFIRNGNYILKDINWQVKKGQHWAMMGLNGSGKSSILNLIHGLTWPSEGELTVLGEKFGQTSIPNLQKRIGWVGSALNTRLNQYEKVEKLILSGLYNSIGLYQNYGQDELDQVDQVMERLEISQLKGKIYHHCSQGEQQFVLIARALISQPELLILDEACNGLDLFATEKLLTTIAKLIESDQAPTIIFVTHHAEQVLPQFDHSLLLKDGQVFDQGLTTDILTTEALSQFYDAPVAVHSLTNGRYLVHVV